MQPSILKLKLQQETAVFRNPLTTEIVETYPLPPPSTIIGLLLSIMGYSTPERIISNVSIQGGHEAMIRDYLWFRRYDPGRQEFQRQQKPILVHTLLDLRTVIHVQFSDANVVARARESLGDHGFLYLGRAEDVAKIEEIKWLGANETDQLLPDEIEDSGLLYDAYVPLDTAQKIHAKGIPYRLASNYKFQEVTVGKRRLMLRECEWLDVLFLEKGSIIETEEHILTDKEGDTIWWCMPSRDPGKP